MVIFPLEIVDFPIQNGGFPIKNCDFPIKNCDFPIKNCDFPIENGDFGWLNQWQGHIPSEALTELHLPWRTSAPVASCRLRTT